MKNLNYLRTITVLLLLSLTFSNCASIFTGSKRRVLFESNPSGAKVYVNGIEKGVTPTQIKVKADDRVDFKLENYKERVVVMDGKFNLVAILNGISIVGWGIDALTGSLHRVNTEYIKVDLENKNSVTVNEYLKRGFIEKVDINTNKKVIETTIVLSK